MEIWKTKNIVFFAMAVLASDFGLVQLTSGEISIISEKAEARGFCGGGRRGGARVSARTTVRTTHSVARPAVPSRYHRPVARPPIYRPGIPSGYRPGVGVGSARRQVRRVARRTANRVAYRTSTGLSYYYGAAVYSMPSSCVSVYWEGQYAVNCGGAIYISEIANGTTVYYPIEVM